MKFALVNNKKTQAAKGLNGICPSCGSDLIANCGDVKVHHWAHKGVRNCDPWWENETEWHRSWKKHFPMKWQEVTQYADNGEKHIADVKTEQGWVLEFQHSYLKPEERRSRDAFYDKLVWIVDGMRRVRDKKQFQKNLEESYPIYRIPTHNNQIYNLPFILREVHFYDECRLLAEWQDSTSLVFFDFHEPDSILWFLLPVHSNSKAYLMNISRKNFIEYHQNDRFEKIYDEQISPLCEQLMSRNPRKCSYIPKRIILSAREIRQRNIRF